MQLCSRLNYRKTGMKIQSCLLDYLIKTNRTSVAANCKLRHYKFCWRWSIANRNFLNYIKSWGCKDCYWIWTTCNISCNCRRNVGYTIPSSSYLYWESYCSGDWSIFHDFSATHVSGGVTTYVTDCTQICSTCVVEINNFHLLDWTIWSVSTEWIKLINIGHHIIYKKWESGSKICWRYDVDKWKMTSNI
jgi:hypothetical protein